MISEYRQKQSFEVEGTQVFYTLTPDPDAPLVKADGPVPEGQMRLVEDEDGVLHWQIPEPPAPPPMPEGAVTEPTLVERDGILHWLFPGEVPQPGDQIRQIPQKLALRSTKESTRGSPKPRRCDTSS